MKPNQFDATQPIRKRFAIKAADAALEANTLKGAAAGIGNIDSHGDVIFPGAFSPEVLAEFLRSGFVALAHEWDDLPIGYPTIAEERGRMLYTEATFHSTSEAQDVRAVASERIAAGKSVGLSVGFFCQMGDCIDFPNGMELLTYARGLGINMDLLDVAAIAAYDDYIRAIIKVSRLVEYSIVTIPANPEAEAMSAKHGCSDAKAQAAQKPISTVRELENLLRDAGQSRSIAAQSITNLKAHLRDAETDEVPPGETTSPPSPGADSAMQINLRARALAARSRALRN
jgi:phage head maturation protease